jgi:hypothetical protein
MEIRSKPEVIDEKEGAGWRLADRKSLTNTVGERGGSPEYKKIATLASNHAARSFVGGHYLTLHLTPNLMKRILGFLVSLSLLGGAVAQAQTATPATTPMNTSSSKMTTTKTMQAPATKTTVKSSTMSNPAGMTKSSTMTKGETATHKSSTMTTPTGMTKSSTSTSSTKMKADGTPDMRYSANKSTRTTRMSTGPLKADGTPDMRYKANKTTVRKTSTKM